MMSRSRGVRNTTGGLLQILIGGIGLAIKLAFCIERSFIEKPAKCFAGFFV
jgi:hypothetical protein